VSTASAPDASLQCIQVSGRTERQSSARTAGSRRGSITARPRSARTSVDRGIPAALRGDGHGAWYRDGSAGP
jgi:hypothetical protein